MDIMNILAVIVPLVLLGVIGLIVIINMIIGLIGGLKKRLAALAAIIVSAIIAAIVTAFVCSPGSGLVTFIMEQINGILAETELGLTLGFEQGSVGEALVYYIAMIVKPVFFTVVYAILSLILCIVMAIVSKFIPILNNIPKVAKRLGGMGVGVVTGLLVSLFLLVPVIGTLTVVADVIDSVSAISAEAEVDEIEEIEEETVSVKEGYEVFKYLGYELLYDGLASENYYGDRVYLREDVGIIFGVVKELGAIGSDLGSIDENTAESLGSSLEALEGSPMLRGVLAGIVSEATQSWSEGEAYLGMEKISAGELFDPIINTLLEILSTTDKDLVVSDLGTAVDMLGVLAQHGMLSGEESEDVLEELNGGEIITDMLEVIGENERMYPLADEVTRLGLRTLASTLGIPSDADERYNDLMNEIAMLMNDTYGDLNREEAVKEGLKNALCDYGVAVGGEALDSVAEGILTDLGSRRALEGDDIKEFFLLYAAVAKVDSSASAGNGIVGLSSTKANSLMINGDGTISVNGVTLQNYTAKNYRNSAAYAFGTRGISLDDAATLYSAESMRSTYITLDDIMAILGNYGDCEDVHAEAEKIGYIFGEFLTIASEEDLEEGNTTKLFERIGGLLDEMKYTETFGPEVTAKLLSAIMQSETLVENLGLSRDSLTNIAERINAHALDKDGGFADATGAVSSTVEAVKTNSKSDATKEEKVQSVETMINSVNTGNAEMLAAVLTPDVVNGVASGTNSSVENSDTVSNSLSDLITNMAEFKEGNPTDDQVSSEAAAVSQVISLAMTGSNEGALFNSGDTKGSLDATPDEFIGQMVESEVVMKTVNTTAKEGENPYGINYSDEDEKNSVANALEDYYASHGGGDELAEKLQNLAIVMDVEIDLGR